VPINARFMGAVRLHNFFKSSQIDRQTTEKFSEPDLSFKIQAAKRFSNCIQ
jgi:hypothetical protein